MKMFLKSLCAGFIIAVIFSVIPFEARCTSISDEVLRLHILANSDSEQDQSLKLKVRNAVLKETENLYKNADSKDEALHLTRQSLDKIRETAEKTIRENGYDYPVRAQIKKVHFSTRIYEQVTMPSGTYDSVQIEIGSGKGKNWWCVMYPSLCIGVGTDSDTLRKELSDDEYSVVTSGEKVRFKFKIVEYYETVKNWFKKIN